jgi:ZIP family zinc transporter
MLEFSYINRGDVMNQIGNALLGTLFTWFATAIGSAFVFFFKKPTKKLMMFLFGLGAGIMLAASIFSLIFPSYEMVQEKNLSYWLLISGIFAGFLFIFILDILMPHFELNKIKQTGPVEQTQGMPNQLLFILAIVLHNIPEGIAVGVAFGCASTLGNINEAWILALGIAIQNIPEGMAVSLPLRNSGMSRFNAFLYGQASGLVEPIGGLIGVLLSFAIQGSLPFLLCFASGAMIYVIVEELIPAGKENNTKLGTIGVCVGFLIMMILDLMFS